MTTATRVLMGLLLLGGCEADPPDVGERSAASNEACTFGADRWGPDDQAGQSNTQTPEKVLEARQLIRTGRTWSLGHELREGMPTFPFPGLVGYQFELPPPVSLGSLVAQEELISGELGQVGTEMDALGHMCFMHGTSDVFAADCYNGHTEGGIWSAGGLTHLGIEHIKPYFTRGILLDVSRYANGGERMAPGQAVTAAMILATLAAENLSIDDIHEGDVVLVRTGHEDLWHDPSLGFYYGATPGLDLGAAQLLASRCIGNVGADNWPVEVNPPVDLVPSGTFVPVHEYNLTVVGLPQQENLALRAFADDLADEFAHHPSPGVYEFAYAYNPVALAGATGSPGAPLAIK